MATNVKVQMAENKKLVAGLPVDTISIPGVVCKQAYTVNNGYRNETEIIGEDGNTCAFVFANEGTDIAVSGYLDPDAIALLKPPVPPATGDIVTVEGWDLAVLSGVSIAYVPEGVATFSATIKLRQPKPAPAAANV